MMSVSQVGGILTVATKTGRVKPSFLFYYDMNNLALNTLISVLYVTTQLVGWPSQPAFCVHLWVESCSLINGNVRLKKSSAHFLFSRRLNTANNRRQTQPWASSCLVFAWSSHLHTLHITTLPTQLCHRLCITLASTPLYIYWNAALNGISDGVYSVRVRVQTKILTAYCDTPDTAVSLPWCRENSGWTCWRVVWTTWRQWIHSCSGGRWPSVYTAVIGRNSSVQVVHITDPRGSRTTSSWFQQSSALDRPFFFSCFEIN